MAKLYFYYAAMNAGKSTTLLQADFNYRERGMETMLWTAALDDRLGVGAIGSRIALSAAAHTFDESVDLFEAISNELRKRKLDCILVDEAQFLSQPHVLQLCEVADQLKIPVLCYGLRTDFRGELFEGSQCLLAWADELVEIKTICHSGSKATMTVRVDERGYAVQDGPQVEIGGNERYVSVSRAEFKKIVRGDGRIEPLQGSLPLT